MRSATFSIRPQAPLVEQLPIFEGAEEFPRPPDAVAAFLPPSDDLPSSLQALAQQWPASVRFGCEAVTQFSGSETTSGGALQLFWFDDPDHRVEVASIESSDDRLPTPAAIRAALEAVAGVEALFLLVDGLRFPVAPLLSSLRHEIGDELPRLAGGLASQSEPIVGSGARVFSDRTVFESACLLIGFHGVEMEVEVIRGWHPASPIYRVTEADGPVLKRIGERSASEWLAEIFTVDGSLIDLPRAAHQFPFIIEGPKPERAGLYRSLRFFDQPAGCLTLWGDVEVGDRIRLAMHREPSTLDLTPVTEEGRRVELPPEAALLYACVGREKVMGPQAANELAAVHTALREAPLSGFFTFGEIAPGAGSPAALFNHTAVLALLKETSSQGPRAGEHGSDRENDRRAGDTAGDRTPGDESAEP